MAAQINVTVPRFFRAGKHEQTNLPGLHAVQVNAKANVEIE